MLVEFDVELLIVIVVECEVLSVVVIEVVSELDTELGVDDIVMVVGVGELVV